MEEGITNDEQNDNSYISEEEYYTRSIDYSEIDENEYNFVKFIQAIKDDRLDLVEELVGLNPLCI